MTTRITTDNITDGTIVKSDLGTITNNSISWQSKITADGSTNTTLEAGKGYFIDTTSNAHTVVLPAAAEVGDTIYIKDYGRTFATNNVTVNRNGHNIDGTSLNATLSTKDTLLQLTYIDSTKGWMTVENEGKILNDPQYISATGGTVTTSGDYKIHTFTSSSTFVVSETGNDLGSNGVDYLVVAGGGGGGTNNNPCSSGGGGGGGSGGYTLRITT